MDGDEIMYEFCSININNIFLITWTEVSTVAMKQSANISSMAPS